MGLWDLTGATIGGQHYFWADAAPVLRAGKPHDVVRLVDAAVAVAQAGLFISASEKDCGYLNVSESLKALSTLCKRLAQQLPEACTERRSVPDKMGAPTGDCHGSLHERILDCVAALIECDNKVTAAEDSETTDLDLATPEGKPFYVTTERGPSSEILYDGRLETAEQLAELLREAVELAGDVYDAMSSRKQ